MQFDAPMEKFPVFNLQAKHSTLIVQFSVFATVVSGLLCFGLQLETAAPPKEKELWSVFVEPEATTYPPVMLATPLHGEINYEMMALAPRAKAIS